MKWTYQRQPIKNNLPKAIRDILNNPTFIKEIESIINDLPKRGEKKPWVGSLVISTKHLKKKLYQFSATSSEDRSRENISYLILRGQHHPNTKPHEDVTRKSVD